MKSSVRTILYFLAAVIITAGIAVGVTLRVVNSQRGDRVVISNEEYQSLIKMAPLEELSEKIQEDQYAQSVTEDDLLTGALKGMLEASGDPYAQYYTEEEYLDYLRELDGKYSGVGMMIGQPEDGGGATVLKVYSGSSAETAGIKVGDMIVAVEGEPLSGLSLSDINRLLEGDTDTEVTVSVLRGETPIQVKMLRQKGIISRVDHKLFNQRTGYIRLDMFTSASVEEFAEALRDLTDRGMRCLVVDIRNNPGGELESAAAVADLLLGEGKIVTIVSKDGTEKVYNSDVKCVSVPMAILVNEHSASASEIVAAAIQENEAGLIVGVTTFGKGVVQTTMQLQSNKGWVKLTTAAYLTPKGNSVEGTGVQPDIDIDLSDDMKNMAVEEINQDDDAQLWAALDEVRAQADEREDAVQQTEGEGDAQDAGADAQ